MALIPVNLQQVCDTASEPFAGEILQQQCDSGAMWLELWQHGQKMDELYLDQDMLEVFINLEAYYRQQGIDNSAVYAFQKLSEAGC